MVEQMLLKNFALCNIKRSRFMKEKNARGILSSFGLFRFKFIECYNDFIVVISIKWSK